HRRRALGWRSVRSRKSWPHILSPMGRGGVERCGRRTEGEGLMSQSVMWKLPPAADLRAKAQAGAIVVLPVASMEQHGPHLPVGVDTILSEAVCKGGAELAVKDVPVVVAPTLWCGMA